MLARLVRLAYPTAPINVLDCLMVQIFFEETLDIEMQQQQKFKQISRPTRRIKVGITNNGYLQIINVESITYSLYTIHPLT